MKHQFEEGQKVVCILGRFPLIKEFGGTGREAVDTPKKNEVLIIDEILGEFLRFDKYDTDDSFNWWAGDHFAPFDEMEGIKEELLQYAIN
jgi:hypothetical protein